MLRNIRRFTPAPSPARSLGSAFLGRRPEEDPRGHCATFVGVMASPWAVSCSCGWVAVAETLDEAGALIEVHAGQATTRTKHAITIQGNAEDRWGRRRRGPPSESAPI